MLEQRLIMLMLGVMTLSYSRMLTSHPASFNKKPTRIYVEHVGGLTN